MDAEKGSKTEEDLQSIRDEIKRIVNITDNLLTFSKSEGGEVVEVEINGLLENALTLLESELNVRSIKHILKLENGLPEVMARGGELRQAFINIFSNAIEAMPNGGTLTITAQCIQKKGLPLVSIRIIDTGCGIAEEDIGKIFEPFFSTRKEIKGVGLGLSSSYTTIDSYGGKLNVESEEGHGTTFIIDLPVKI
jgi:signal transduction histidine kinase